MLKMYRSAAVIAACSKSHFVPHFRLMRLGVMLKYNIATTTITANVNVIFTEVVNYFYSL